jgi:hypothetical protein
MNLEYRSLLDPGFSPDSRVWVYQSSRLFTLGEALEIEDMLKDFTVQWKSHGLSVKAAGYLFFGQFIILMADETSTGVGGCSTDSSVRFIKELEQRFNVALFDRNSLAFIIKDKIELLPFSQFQYAVENNFVNGETLYFNNLVSTKAELENNWLIKIKDSWLAKRLSVSGTVNRET